MRFGLTTSIRSLLATAIVVCLTWQSAFAAQCGYANSNSYSSAPQSIGSLCSSGSPGSVSGPGPWNWTCSDGGGTVNCSSGLCGVTFEWREGAFGTCDCGTRLQSRGVWCYRNGTMTDPDQSGCYANAGPKPAWQQSCTPSGCPATGVCDNSVVNGCSAGSAINISSDASNDYWLCSGPNGGANSGQCSKAKPPVVETCIATGRPVPAGQTQCPTESCFVWATGAFVSNETNSNTGGHTLGDLNRVSWLSNNYISNMVGAGSYPKIYDNKNGALGYASDYTLDSIVVSRKAKITLYSGANYTGTVLFEQTGPYVLSNCGNSMLGNNSLCDNTMGRNWPTTGLYAQFPPSTRHQISTMAAWSGGSHGSYDSFWDVGPRDGSLKVECLP